MVIIGSDSDYCDFVKFIDFVTLTSIRNRKRPINNAIISSDYRLSIKFIIQFPSFINTS